MIYSGGQRSIRLIVFLATFLLASACGGGGGGGGGGGLGGVNTTPNTTGLTLSSKSMSFSANQGTSPVSQSITLTNTSTYNSLNWTTETTTPNVSESWLKINSSKTGVLAAGASTTLEVKVLGQALGANRYSGSISLTTSENNGSAVIPVALTISNPSAASVTANSVLISGSAGVGQLSGLTAGTLDANSAPEEKVDNAKVIITIIDPVTLARTERVVFTDERGNYSANISASPGEKITIRIEKDGYTRFTKTLTTGDDLVDGQNFSVNGTLAKSEVVTVPLASTNVFAASTTPQKKAFRFGVIEDRDGQKTTFTSLNDLVGPRAASDSGAIPVLDISIPAVRVGAQVQSLTAQLASFDPSNPDHRKMFPGQFVGSGDPRTSVSQYALESAVFLQADIVQDDGNILQLVEPGVLAAATDDPVTITQFLPSTGCISLRDTYGDWDMDAANGIQAPVYAYNPNDGQWGFLGNGDIVRYNAILGEYNLVSYSPPLSVEDLNCTDGDLYLKITVAGDWYTFWNLDYPLYFSLPDSLTVKGAAKYSDGSPASTYLYASRSGGSNMYDAYSNSQGAFSLKITTSDISRTGLYDLYVLNPKTYQYNSVSLDTYNSSIVEISPNRYELTLPDFSLVDPFSCKVTGLVKEGLIAKASEWVYAWNSSGNYWNYTTTGPLGRYTMKSPCDEDVVVWVRGQTKLVNVNGTSIYNSSNPYQEKLDTKVQVTVNDFLIKNEPPQVNLDAAPLNVTAGDPIELFVWAWDPEGAPVTISWSSASLIAKDPTLATTLSSTSRYLLLKTANLDGEYTITATGTDPVGNKASKSVSIKVTPKLINRPPKILDFGYSFSFSGQDCTRTGNLWVTAVDPDADTLSFSWSDGSGNPLSVTTVDIKKGLFTWNSPLSGILRLTISDGRGGYDTLAKSITVPGAPTPEIWGTYYAPILPLDSDNLTLNTYATIKGGSSLQYSWTLTPPSGGPVALSTDSSTPSAVTALGEVGTYTADLRVKGCTLATTPTQKTARIYIKVSDGNQGPEIIDYGRMGYPTPLYVGDTDTFYAFATDDRDAEWNLIYNWYINGVLQPQTTPTFTWTPTAAVTYNITMIAEDTQGYNSLLVNFNENGSDIVVQEAVSIVPAIYGIYTDGTLLEGEPTILYADVDDGEGGSNYTLFWEDVTEPSAIDLFNSTQLEPVWMPTVVDEPHHIRLTAINITYNTSAIFEEFIIVTPLQGLTVVNAYALPETPYLGTTFRFYSTVANPDGGALAYEWSITAPTESPVGTFAGESPEVLIDTTYGAGMYWVDLTVTDTFEQTDTYSFQVELLDPDVQIILQ